MCERLQNMMMANKDEITVNSGMGRRGFLRNGALAGVGPMVWPVMAGANNKSQ
ncbi:MAG: hypothetical protein K9M57_05530 [Phycisphaerae bacterium]|nr:hypothetical protein [Phycisphaerae bacterium]